MLERDKQAPSHHAPLLKVIAVLLMWHFCRPSRLQCKQKKTFASLAGRIFSRGRCLAFRSRVVKQQQSDVCDRHRLNSLGATEGAAGRRLSIAFP